MSSDFYTSIVIHLYTALKDGPIKAEGEEAGARPGSCESIALGCAVVEGTHGTAMTLIMVARKQG